MTKRGQRSRAGSLAVAVAVATSLLPGCVARQGDFGRVEPSDFNRHVGKDPYAHVPGFDSTVSDIVPLTADEIELRAQGYTLAARFGHKRNVHPIEPHPLLAPALSVQELPDPHVYAAELTTDGYRGPEARVNAIIDDIHADLAGIDAFERLALEVQAADAMRLIDLERVPVSEPVAFAVALRIDENRALMETVIVALERKVAGYELALGETIVTGAIGARASAGLEVENIRRRLARLKSDLRHEAGRYALNLPGESECLERSIARAC